MSRILPIQPPHPFPPGVWKKDQEESLRRIWQDIAAFLRGSGGGGGGVSGVIDAATLPGNDASAQLIAAVDSLPSSGGIISGLGFGAEAQLSQNIFSTLANKPVTFLFGATRFHTLVQQTIRYQAQLQILGTNIFSNASLNYQSCFQWDGPSGGTVFLFDCSRDCVMDGIGVEQGLNSIGIGIRIDHASPPTGAFISANNRFYHVSIGRSTCAIQIGNNSVANNSEHVFEDIDIYDVGTYGYYINNAQSKQMKIHRGHITDRTHGVYQNNGSFTAENVNLNSNGNDFSIGSADDILLIKGCESENSTRFLSGIGGAAVSPWAVTLQSNSYIPSAMDSGGTFIYFPLTGGLTLIGNDFSGGAVGPANAHIYAQGTYPGAGRVVSIGNIYMRPTVFTASPVFGNMDVFSIGDNGWGPSGVVQMPVLLGTGSNGAVTLANGANNDIQSITALTNAPMFFRITGPTAAFSITGFAGGVAGQELKVFNATTQTMTIRNLTGSATANQIQTLTGADVTARAAIFTYDGPLQKWILMSSN